MTESALPSGTVDSFLYNGDGRRVQKLDSTGFTNHVWNEEGILLETNQVGAIQVVFSKRPQGDALCVKQRRSGQDYFYLYDGSGSASELTDSAGTLTDQYVYDSFGNLLTAPTTQNPYRYGAASGYYYDSDTDDYMILSRYYGPSSSRFISKQGTSGAPSPQGMLYTLFPLVSFNGLLSPALVLGIAADKNPPKPNACGTDEQSCIDDAKQLALKLLALNPNCFQPLLNATGSTCTSQQLTDCLINTLKNATFGARVPA